MFSQLQVVASFPGLFSIHTVHLQYAKMMIKLYRGKFGKKATSAYLLLRWPNRDEFLGVEVGGSLVPRLFSHVNQFSVLQATESWAGPGNEARLGGVSLQLGNIKGY